MPVLSLNRANKMIRAAFAKAEELKLKPIAVCVHDSGGVLKAYQAQDGTSNGRFHVASGKVRGALTVGSGSRWLQNQAGERPHFLAGVNSVIAGGVVPVAGAVLARDKNGAVVAAVGISGDTSDNDEACAVAAVEACGLTPDIG
jgi:uncharacterized protein GlcG (DUF336 family)